MIPTGILRAIPIKHWLPVLIRKGQHGEAYIDIYGASCIELQEVITGYKYEEAWWADVQSISMTGEPYVSWPPDAEQQLRNGEEVEGFVWKPIGTKK